MAQRIQTLVYGFCRLKNPDTIREMPVAGVEPARVISPTDFESASSANSNTPARR